MIQDGMQEPFTSHEHSYLLLVCKVNNTPWKLCVVGTREDNFIRPNDEVELQQSKDLQRASNSSALLEKYFRR